MPSNSSTTYDAIVVGAGPNGLAAAITLAMHDLSVAIYEAKATVGGGCRSQELTLPGYIHDVCSSIHPLAVGSPFFRKLPLSRYGLEWIHPDAPLAHPFDDGTCALLEHSIDQTAKELGQDQAAYADLMTPFTKNWPMLEDVLLSPLSFPAHPIAAMQFASKAIRSAKGLAKKIFTTKRAQGLFAGIAAHSFLPLDQCLSAAFGLVLGVAAHMYGWPMPRRGSQSIVNALKAHFLSLGGKIKTECEIAALEELPASRAVVFDQTPRQILKIAGAHLSTSDQKALRKFRYGPGVFKIDWALDSPIPWQAESCRRAATVHIGGTLEEIAASEKAAGEGKHTDKPYVLLAQHSLFDSSRAPPGKHTAWAYCHVPHASTRNMTQAIEEQIERFAPNFRSRIIAKSTMNTNEIQRYNPNYIGGDIIGGVQDLWQLVTRPTMRFVPYATSHPRLFICSSSTPPGGGVHGMCGFHAAKAVLKRAFDQHTLKPTLRA